MEQNTETKGNELEHEVNFKAIRITNDGFTEEIICFIQQQASKIYGLLAMSQEELEIKATKLKEQILAEENRNMSATARFVEIKIHIGHVVNDLKFAVTSRELPWKPFIATYIRDDGLRSLQNYARLARCHIDKSHYRLGIRTLLDIATILDLKGIWSLTKFVNRCLDESILALAKTNERSSREEFKRAVNNRANLWNWLSNLEERGLQVSDEAKASLKDYSDLGVELSSKELDDLEEKNSLGLTISDVLQHKLFPKEKITVNQEGIAVMPLIGNYSQAANALIVALTSISGNKKKYDDLSPEDLESIARKCSTLNNLINEIKNKQKETSNVDPSGLIHE